MTTGPSSRQTRPDATPSPAADGSPAEAPAPVVDLLDPAEGIPPVIDTPDGLDRAARALAAGTGPVAVDAERASGFRYGQRAFLVQLRRAGAGTWLVDPEALDGLEPLQEALTDVEWVLHAASQDLPCLAEQGMRPDLLFDTELAARLLGMPRVGLGAVIEAELGLHLAKEHSAVDWSTRPLPEPWLRYAALDVEVLVALRDTLAARLTETGKDEIARQEFEHVRLTTAPVVRADPWRRTSGLHQVRERRQLAAVRELWLERDRLARHRDVAPGRLIPDSAIVAAAHAMPQTVPQLLETRGFHGRAARREAPRWLRAIDAARTTEDLPPLHVPGDSPPPVRQWADKDPLAAARLTAARNGIADVAEQWTIPVENVLTPDVLRRLIWRPPIAGAHADLDAVDAALASSGARPWQRELVGGILLDALRLTDPAAAPSPAASSRSAHG
ncbi:3'-5' exonuclease [Tersicoccus solisilvae]|uniref:3'-5' exonuclease n=1 Tax=Tersicoccus solisilvae TaxID=1882339 RepID=A0ABQ1PNJ8_9MICC|nr:HRDC domain-containing protein [Tersicoccus solisilvae]GGD00208.1 3'-5' exonuclease [Tersicoccus solisilvae]